MQIGQSARHHKRLRGWLMVSLVSLVAAALAACSRTWQDRAREVADEGVAATATVAAPIVEPSVVLVATATPALAARVNGQPILLADYERQLAAYRAELLAQSEVTPTTSPGGFVTAVEAQVLERMIDVLLVEQEAVKLGLLPSSAEVEAQLQADIAAGGGPEAFAKWLESTDQQEEDFRAALRSSLILQRVALAVTVASPPGAQEVAAGVRTEAFLAWLAERRATAVVERWVGR